MTDLQYSLIPNLKQWQKDSSVRLARRSTDKTLSHIDELVGQFNQTNDIGVQMILTSDLRLRLSF